MIGSIFAVIELILKLIGLWDQFLDYSDAKRRAQDEVKRQEREKAADKAANAETDGEIFDAETDVTNNMP